MISITLLMKRAPLEEIFLCCCKAFDANIIIAKDHREQESIQVECIITVATRCQHQWGGVSVQ